MHEVADIHKIMPEDDPSDTLKSEMIERQGKSNENNLLELFNNVVLGDRSPSQFLNYSFLFRMSSFTIVNLLCVYPLQPNKYWNLWWKTYTCKRFVERIHIWFQVR